MSTQYRVYIFGEEGSPREFKTRKLQHVLELCETALIFSGFPPAEQREILSTMGRYLRKHPDTVYTVASLIVVRKENT